MFEIEKEKLKNITSQKYIIEKEKINIRESLEKELTKLVNVESYYVELDLWRGLSRIVVKIKQPESPYNSVVLHFSYENEKIKIGLNSKEMDTTEYGKYLEVQNKVNLILSKFEYIKEVHKKYIAKYEEESKLFMKQNELESEIQNLTMSYYKNKIEKVIKIFTKEETEKSFEKLKGTENGNPVNVYLCSFEGIYITFSRVQIRVQNGLKRQTFYIGKRRYAKKEILEMLDNQFYYNGKVVKNLTEITKKNTRETNNYDCEEFYKEIKDIIDTKIAIEDF